MGASSVSQPRKSSPKGQKKKEADFMEGLNSTENEDDWDNNDDEEEKDEDDDGDLSRASGKKKDLQLGTVSFLETFEKKKLEDKLKNPKMTPNTVAESVIMEEIVNNLSMYFDFR
jgi:hypothetical protein